MLPNQSCDVGPAKTGPDEPGCPTGTYTVHHSPSLSAWYARKSNMAHMQPVSLGLLVEPKSEHFPKFVELDTAQVLGENIGGIIIRADEEDFNLLIFH